MHVTSHGKKLNMGEENCTSFVQSNNFLNLNDVLYFQLYMYNVGLRMFLLVVQKCVRCTTLD